MLQCMALYLYMFLFLVVEHSSVRSAEYASLPFSTVFSYHMGWWRGIAVMHFIRSTKLLYARPG